MTNTLTPGTIVRYIGSISEAHGLARVEYPTFDGRYVLTPVDNRRRLLGVRPASIQRLY
jgi:hypothetical protein